MSSKKEKAIILRKKGLSYSQIMKRLNVPSKGTLSYWFKKIKLTKKEEERLEKNKIIAQKSGLMKANKKRTARIKKENEESYKIGRGLIKNIDNKKLFLIGISLYWAEGTKKQNTLNTKIVEFSNSDPGMIKIFMKFIRKIMKTKEEKIRSGIYIHDNIDPKFAKNFWSEITKLPKDRFFIVKSLSSASKKKRPKNRLPYGTLKITISDRLFFYKIKGAIDKLKEIEIKE
jgi:hypothetical protein